MLVDSRSDDDLDFHQGVAATAVGTARELEGRRARRAARRLPRASPAPPALRELPDERARGAHRRDLLHRAPLPERDRAAPRVVRWRPPTSSSRRTGSIRCATPGSPRGSAARRSRSRPWRAPASPCRRSSPSPPTPTSRTWRRPGSRARIGFELERKDLADMRWEEMWDAALRIRNLFLTTPLPEEVRAALAEPLAARFAGVAGGGALVRARGGLGRRLVRRAARVLRQRARRGRRSSSTSSSSGRRSGPTPPCSTGASSASTRGAA